MISSVSLRRLLFAALLLAPLAALQAGEPISNSIGMKLVYIAPGTFTMGQDGPAADYFDWPRPRKDDGADFDEKPAHRVTISKAFHIGGRR